MHDAKVFISYSGKDEAAARAVKTELEQLGFDAWLAADEIHEGEAIPRKIRQAMDDADAVVLVIGDEAPGDWTRHEWSLALQRAVDPERPVPIVPLLMKGAELPPFLRGHLQFAASDRPERWIDLIRQDDPRLYEWKSTPSSSERLRERLSEIDAVVARLDAAASE